VTEPMQPDRRQAGKIADASTESSTGFRQGALLGGTSRSEGHF
jgi:hypothetical protein